MTVIKFQFLGLMWYWPFSVFACGTQALKQSFQNSFYNFRRPPPSPTPPEITRKFCSKTVFSIFHLGFRQKSEQNMYGDAEGGARPFYSFCKPDLFLPNIIFLTSSAILFTVLKRGCSTGLETGWKPVLL